MIESIIVDVLTIIVVSTVGQARPWTGRVIWNRLSKRKEKKKSFGPLCWNPLFSTRPFLVCQNWVPVGLFGALWRVAKHGTDDFEL